LLTKKFTKIFTPFCRSRRADSKYTYFVGSLKVFFYYNYIIGGKNSKIVQIPRLSGTYIYYFILYYIRRAILIQKKKSGLTEKKNIPIHVNSIKSAYVLNKKHFINPMSDPLFNDIPVLAKYKCLALLPPLSLHPALAATCTQTRCPLCPRTTQSDWTDRSSKPASSSASSSFLLREPRWGSLFGSRPRSFWWTRGLPSAAILTLHPRLLHLCHS